MEAQLDRRTNKERTGIQLDLLKVGQYVDVKALTDYMPEHVVRKIESIASLNGQSVSELTPIDQEKLHLMVKIRNIELVKRLTCQDYPDSLWSNALRTEVKRWLKRISRSLEKARQKIKRIIVGLYVRLQKLNSANVVTC